MNTQQKWDSINKTKLNATQKEGHGEMAEAIGILGWENTEVKEAVAEVHSHFAKKAPELLSGKEISAVSPSSNDKARAAAKLKLVKAKMVMLLQLKNKKK